MMKEFWEMIGGYPHYAVSSFGRVRNLNTGKVLKHQSSNRGGGYAFVNLYLSGSRMNWNVHALVARHFIGRRPDGLVVHHKDGNRMNPRLENLTFLYESDHRRLTGGPKV